MMPVRKTLLLTVHLVNTDVKAVDLGVKDPLLAWICGHHRAERPTFYLKGLRLYPLSGSRKSTMRLESL